MKNDLLALGRPTSEDDLDNLFYQSEALSERAEDARQALLIGFEKIIEVIHPNNKVTVEELKHQIRQIIGQTLKNAK